MAPSLIDIPLHVPFYSIYIPHVRDEIPSSTLKAVIRAKEFDTDD